MADQKISDLTPTTPADADNLPIERGAAANFKVSFNALRTWLDGFFAPASHPADTNNPHSVTAAQAGADPTGTAAAAVAAHEAAGDPHSQYLTQAEADPLYDASGTAAAAVAAHEAAPDPHSQYLTNAEGDAAYEPIGETDAHRGTTNEHPTFTNVAPGFVPASGGGTTNYLRADGTFAEPPGGGGGSGTYNEVTKDGASISTGRSILELRDSGDATVIVTDDAPGDRTIIEVNATAGAGGGGVGAGSPFDVGELTQVSSAAGDGEIISSGLAASTVTGHIGTVNIHVDHTSVDITAGDGLTGGGDISASRSLAVDATVQRQISGGLNGNLVSRDAAGNVQDAGASTASFDPSGSADAVQDNLNTHTAGQTNSHAQIDTHIGTSDIHRTQAADDARYGQLAAVNAWTENQTFNGVGLVSAQVGRFSLTYAPDGIYDPLDGGFEAAEGASILLGSVTEVASLKHATGESQQVYVTENGELFGVDPPEPAWSISATDSTDTTAGSGGGQSAWVEMGFTPALVLPQDVTPSDEIQVDTRIYWANLASNASGTVSIGFGIDGADPVAPGATEQLGNGFEGPIPTSWTATGLTLTAGQTLSLFMRRESGSSGQFNPVAQGTTQAHNVTIRDRREGGTGGDGDVTGPASATNDNFAAFDGVSGKVIKDAGVSASDFDAAGTAAAAVAAHEAAGDPHSQYLTQAEGDGLYAPINAPYALEMPHTWTVATGTVDNALDILEWVIPAPVGQTATIKRMSYKLKSGSVSLTLQVNASPVAGYTGLAVTTTRGTTAGDVALSDLDELDIVIDSGSGTGLSVTLFVEYERAL